MIINLAASPRVNLNKRARARDRPLLNLYYILRKPVAQARRARKQFRNNFAGWLIYDSYDVT